MSGVAGEAICRRRAGGGGLLWHPSARQSPAAIGRVDAFSFQCPCPGCRGLAAPRHGGSSRA